VQHRQPGSVVERDRSPGAFEEACEQIGLLFASHAAVALAGAQHEGHLKAGMRNRDVIGQAKGILMERYKIDAQQAFAVLSRVSQEMNRKLADVAAELAGSGELPQQHGRGA
jgi:AmiR/NasT family two-component response regulator